MADGLPAGTLSASEAAGERRAVGLELDTALLGAGLVGGGRAESPICAALGVGGAAAGEGVVAGEGGAAGENAMGGEGGTTGEGGAAEVPTACVVLTVIFEAIESASSFKARCSALPVPGRLDPSMIRVADRRGPAIVWQRQPTPNGGRFRTRSA